MTYNEFENWINEIEVVDGSDELKQAEKGNILVDAPYGENLSSDEKAEIIKKVMSVIKYGKNDDAQEIDVDAFLASFTPCSNEEEIFSKKEKNLKGMRMFLDRKRRVKAAAVLIIGCLAIIGLSGVVYAAVNGRLSGVHISTPEVDGLLDKENEVQKTLTEPLEETVVINSEKYTGTTILSDDSFEMPEMFNTVTDVPLSEEEKGYVMKAFVFDIGDVCVFTKKAGNGWRLDKDDKVYMTISIDTAFAACEPEGEYIEFAYVYKGRYIVSDIKKIADEIYTFEFSIPESGEYYFAITNASLSYIKVTTLNISE